MPTPVAVPSTTTSAATSATRAAAAPRTAWPPRPPPGDTAASGSAGEKHVANTFQRPCRVGHVTLAKLPTRDAGWSQYHIITAVPRMEHG